MADDGTPPALHRWIAANAAALGKLYRLRARERTGEGVLDYMRLLAEKGRLWRFDNGLRYWSTYSRKPIKCDACGVEIPGGTVHSVICQSLLWSYEVNFGMPEDVAQLHAACLDADAARDPELYCVERIEKERAEQAARNAQLAVYLAEARKSQVAATPPPATRKTSKTPKKAAQDDEEEDEEEDDDDDDDDDDDEEEEDEVDYGSGEDELPDEPPRGWRKIKVEPAKSGRSSCRKCRRTIAKDALRVYDNTTWQLMDGSDGDHEGASRGYIEDEDPRYPGSVGTITRSGVLVHLECYTPHHPRDRSYFDLRSGKAAHRAALNAFVAGAGAAKRPRDGDEEEEEKKEEDGGALPLRKAPAKKRRRRR